MAVSIHFNNGSYSTVWLPVNDRDQKIIREVIRDKYASHIVADGHEGAACINAYRRMQGEKPLESLRLSRQRKGVKHE
jgi:hypothetical protein